MLKKHVVRLSEAERERLQALLSGGVAAARTLTHARMLLKADQGDLGPSWSDEKIATALKVDPETVAGIRREYVTDGLDRALNRKRPDRDYARKLDGEQKAHLIALACGSSPEGYKGWSLRLLAEHLVKLEVVDSISHETIRRTFQQTNSNRG